MGNLEETCDPNDTDWSESPTLFLMEAAKAGIPRAQKELASRQAQMIKDLQSME